MSEIDALEAARDIGMEVAALVHEEGEWGDAEVEAIKLSLSHASLCAAIAQAEQQKRTADALERIADLLKSWDNVGSVSVANVQI